VVPMLFLVPCALETAECSSFTYFQTFVTEFGGMLHSGSPRAALCTTLNWTKLLIEPVGCSIAHLSPALLQQYRIF
jgi:hypothetical protein